MVIEAWSKMRRKPLEPHDAFCVYELWLRGSGGKKDSTMQTNQLHQDKRVFKHLFQHLTSHALGFIWLLEYCIIPKQYLNNIRLWVLVRAVIKTEPCWGPSNKSCNACTLQTTILLQCVSKINGIPFAHMDISCKKGFNRLNFSMYHALCSFAGPMSKSFKCYYS